MSASNIFQAATILLLRDRQTAEPAVQVYMTERPQTMQFLPGHYVFPGGKMDEQDHDPRLLARCAPLIAGTNPEELSLAYWVTALRETFEEAGLLLARDPNGQWIDSQRFQDYREPLLRGEVTFWELVEKANVALATDTMRYFGHRLTPRRVSQKRFATRYFLTRLPAGMEPIPHAGEVVSAAWVTPQEAMQGFAEGRLHMVPPTLDSLRAIAPYTDVDTLWHSDATVGNPTAEELA